MNTLPINILIFLFFAFCAWHEVKKQESILKFGLYMLLAIIAAIVIVLKVLGVKPA